MRQPWMDELWGTLSKQVFAHHAAWQDESEAIP
jgi:hypothetical protein